MKSATLTVLLALVLSVAVVASAKPDAGSLTIAKGGVTESFENSIDGTTLFYPGAGQLKLLLPGSVTAPQSALADVQSGLSGSREFSMFALDLEGNSFAVVS